MNLVIDVGNTFTKLGVFEGSEIVYKKIIKQENFRDTIQKIREEYPDIKNAIISSVSNLQDSYIKYIQLSFDTLVLDHLVKMPFKNLYDTPSTLGIDRLALVAAAVDQFSGKDVLIIDAGTCVTYDFKNKKEEYFGGAISPGIRLRYSSLHSFTARLPLLQLTVPKNHIGKSTEEAIHSGVVFGILHEIDGVITEYCNIYPDLTVILTGGDAHFLSKRLKNSIFATSNFLLEGLNHILAFNNNK
ncbi:type III pantothenate kinase [Aquimarina muelleri]|uniref:Type III pantothenate kinase n=1 Tax=Aquimarina muelleri TaxID=279356 RepID=A0A918JVV6_9FLAO|nr:type III pantothenate kinase [Aquimarina muelleri]MCX2764094.1 type III pantothenate kinase [Aquimarina muelleri]GGX22765.1 type III pantothenate kinase [Aquimarina muelleri]